MSNLFSMILLMRLQELFS